MTGGPVPQVLVLNALLVGCLAGCLYPVVGYTVCDVRDLIVGCCWLLRGPFLLVGPPLSVPSFEALDVYHRTDLGGSYDLSQAAPWTLSWLAALALGWCILP